MNILEISKKIVNRDTSLFESDILKNYNTLSDEIEDKNVLEAVHLGMKKNTGRVATMGVDAAAIRFRQGLQKIIAKEGPDHKSAAGLSL